MTDPSNPYAIMHTALSLCYSVVHECNVNNIYREHFSWDLIAVLIVICGMILCISYVQYTKIDHLLLLSVPIIIINVKIDCLQSCSAVTVAKY